MATNPYNPVESAAMISQFTPGPPLRQMMITTLINNIPTAVLMPVMVLSQADGTLFKDQSAAIERQTMVLNALLREQKITNELLKTGLSVTTDLDNEYRTDRAFTDVEY